MRQRNAGAAVGPSILDSAWLSYRPKGLLLHGEAASDDEPPARATNAVPGIYEWEDRRWEEADRSLWPDLRDSVGVLACDALRRDLFIKRTYRIAQSDRTGEVGRETCSVLLRD